jgi:hypothetical protein
MASPQGGEPASVPKRRKVEVLEPINVNAIERRPNGEDHEQAVVRVQLSYTLIYEEGPVHPNLLKAWGIEGEHFTTIKESGPVVLDAYGTLAFRDAYESLRDESLRVHSRMLKNFLELGTTPLIVSSLDELGDDPAENKPVVLETGTLADLARYGITPAELWVFLLNHGGARQKARTIFSLTGPEQATYRATDPWLEAGKRRKQLEKAMSLCGATARALRRVQEDGVWWPTHGISLPPLPPEATTSLISDLQRYTEILGEFVVSLKRPARRPPDPEKAHFCCDWYALAMERAANPLYAAGAALYSLVFGETTVDSFEVMCARARKGKNAALTTQS